MVQLRYIVKNPGWQANPANSMFRQTTPGFGRACKGFVVIGAEVLDAVHADRGSWKRLFILPILEGQGGFTNADINKIRFLVIRNRLVAGRGVLSRHGECP